MTEMLKRIIEVIKMNDDRADLAIEKKQEALIRLFKDKDSKVEDVMKVRDDLRALNEIKDLIRKYKDCIKNSCFDTDEEILNALSNFMNEIDRLIEDIENNNKKILDKNERM